MKRLFLILLFSVSAFAQVAVAPYRNARATFIDQNGIPLAGGCVFTYSGGTTTPSATYTDYTGSTPNANPVILDASGSAPIWFGPSSYKLSVFSFGGTNCSTGALQYTIDQIPGNVFMNGTITGATITGGTIDNTPIGPTTPNTGSFTSLMAASLNGYVYCPTSSTLVACVASLPSTGGAVILLTGTYTAGNTCISKGNVNIVGAGVPQYNSGETALTGGTIIQGSVQVCGASNFAISNLGIDVGSAWVAAGNSATNGLIMEGAASGNPADPIVIGASISNIVALGSSAGAAFHGILVEHYSDVEMKNLESRKQQHCFAVKSSHVNWDGAKFQGCSTDGIAIKGDAYTSLTDISITNILGQYDTTPGDTNGIQITATDSTGTTKRVTISNYTGYGLISGTSLNNSSTVGAGALASISLNSHNFYVINTSAGTPTIPTCLLSSGSATIDAVQVNGLLCNINDTQAVAPLSLDNSLTNSTLTGLTFSGSGFASEIEGTVVVNGINDFGAATSQKTIFDQVNPATVLYVYGWNSNRGNQPFGTSVGATAYIFPSVKAMTSSDGTNTTFGGSATATQINATTSSTPDIYNTFTNSGTGAEVLSVHASNFATLQTVNSSGCWFAGNYGSSDFRIVDCQTGGTPNVVKIEKGSSDSSLTIQASGNALFTTNVLVGGGSNVIYRCLTAGALPIGSLTSNAANCGSTIDSGLRTK